MAMDSDNDNDNDRGSDLIERRHIVAYVTYHQAL